jgi:hypothetical protein
LEKKFCTIAMHFDFSYAEHGNGPPLMNEHFNADRILQWREMRSRYPTTFIVFIPIAFLGFKPIDIFLAFSFMQIWGLLVHTTLINKMGWLEYVMVTPSHHRVHHASNIKYLDRNMGMCLIIWDKLFGTFQEELSPDSYEAIRYGLTKPLEKKDPFTIIFHEWRSIHRYVGKEGITWKQRLSYLFKAPGWSHDKSKLTSDEMREAEAAANKY